MVVANGVSAVDKMAPPIVTVFTVDQYLPRKQRSHTFEEALELAGFGRSQLLLVLLAGCSIMASVNEAMGLSIILPASHCDLGLDAAQQGMIGGSVFLGIMTSSYFWGYQADTRGRLVVLKYALIATSICSVASSFVTDFASLMALRFMTGVFIAAPASVVYAYLSEFCTEKTRVQMISYASVLASFGIIYVGLIGWWILSYDWVIDISDSLVYKPWRLLFLFYTLPGFCAGVTYFFCPESPKFLLAQGHDQEALAILTKLHNFNKGSSEVYSVIALTPEKIESNSKVLTGFKGILKSMYDQTAPLVKLPYLVYFLVSCVINISCFSIYGGLALWFPYIINQVIAGGASDDTKICNILQRDPAEEVEVATCNSVVEQETFLFTVMLGIVGTIYCIILSLILGKFSGKTMMLSNTLISATACLALQFVTNAYLLALLFCITIIWAGSCIMLVSALAVSLFPTHVKSMAVSLVNMVGRLSCFAASAVIGILLIQNCPVTLYFLSAMLYLSAALALLLP